ncbi:hypothetical protein WOLCODRAFT_156580 [Wolfiporia cocos MD-104 SS10]|uniref:F-box domain-containing protein n=1 Tax=Wolfiporia cocos (strain MD-104) TaxID=742152 RepID=A0A2H3J7X9_WOLCO|nr:hypothetical protein WOLCODRAFT_156580 [Wolfiporia cocos MD-104 SS10]
MTDEMKGQPAAPGIVEGSAFDIEARMLREIEWRPLLWNVHTGAFEPLISRRDALLPRFNSETAASRIPIGIWDKILECLEYEPETLNATEKVCSGWFLTSHRLRSKYKSNNRGPDSIGRVRLYARHIKTIPKPRRIDTRVHLQGSAAEEGKRRSGAANQPSLAHVGTFAAMFAGEQLPRLSSLVIHNGEWTPGAMQQSVFLHLSSFHSITSLILTNHITLPSIAVLLRLVCAFGCLEELSIRHLRLLHKRVPPASRRWAPSPTLKKLVFEDLNFLGELRPLYAYAELETSSGSKTVLFLLNAVSCSDQNQLLHCAGKTLRKFLIDPLDLLSGTNPHSIQPLRVPDVDLSRNVGLRELSIRIGGDIPSALLERVETYGMIRRMISSTCHTVLERITIEVQDPSAASPSTLSHVLLALRGAVCPPDHSLAPEKYASLKSVGLLFIGKDEPSKTQLKADWANLAPIWFPSLYSRGIMK